MIVLFRQLRSRLWCWGWEAVRLALENPAFGTGRNWPESLGATACKPVAAGCCAATSLSIPMLPEAPARKRTSLTSFARLDVRAVIWRFLSDRNVMRMVLPNRRG